MYAASTAALSLDTMRTAWGDPGFAGVDVEITRAEALGWQGTVTHPARASSATLRRVVCSITVVAPAASDRSCRSLP